jgi:hypothetical protein
MLVFLVNHNVENAILWWDGRDIANQTSCAFVNRYFTGDNPSQRRLTNGILTITMSSDYRTITSSIVGGSITSTASFLRINGCNPTYGSGPAYVIYNGIVRDIVQQEAEWSGGISEILYVNSFDNTFQQWSVSGSSPYLSDNDGNYIRDDDDNHVEGWFGFRDLSDSLVPACTKIRFECYCQGDEYFQFEINDGTNTFGPYNIQSLPSSYGWKEYDVSDILNTREKVNNAKIRVRYKFNTGSASNVYIRRCRLDVATCPNVYSQMYFTLPANATYYTYALRLVFVNSSQSRNIADLNAIRLSVSGGSQRAENGTDGGYPIYSSVTGLFYNFTSAGFQSGWAHHWGEFISGSSGAGLMFRDSANQKLYVFDSIASQKTGALNIITSGGQFIEFSPVGRASYPASFQSPLDVAWHGAVVTFNSDPIYPTTGTAGLWVMVEAPPTVEVSTTD